MKNGALMSEKWKWKNVLKTSQRIKLYISDNDIEFFTVIYTPYELVKIEKDVTFSTVKQLKQLKN